MSAEEIESQDGHEEQLADHDQHELETEAKRFGWVPLDEFRGSEDNWVDAETFVKRGKELNPILKENNKRLLSQITALEARLEEQSLTIKEFGKMYEKMTSKAYEKALKEVKAQMRQAQREGEYELADELQEKFDTLQEESKNIVAPAAKEPAQPTRNPRVEAIMTEWNQENKWYGQDPEMTALADGLAIRAAQARPDLVGQRELLDLITDKVKKAMPHKFKNPQREKGSPVAGGGQTRSGTKSGKKSYNDLPSEAKSICDRFVKEGLFKDRDAYCSEYFDE